MATIDREALNEAYNDVRDDKTETKWAVFKYNDTGIGHDCSGTEFEDFQSKFTDEERAFGFLRVETGDEMSKRAKFTFITWIGNQVSPLKKAKVSTDKGHVKQIIQNFAKELMISDLNDLEEDLIKQEVQKAGGANYGTGAR